MGAIFALPCCMDRTDDVPTSHGDLREKSISQTLVDGTSLDGSIKTLVRRLSSLENSSANLPSYEHPWATRPRSIAAQAALTIATRIRRANMPSVTDAFLEAGCMHPLLGMLTDDVHPDRQDAAIVALDAILEKSSESSRLDEILTKGVVLCFCRIMASPAHSEGARMSCAGIAHALAARDPGLRSVYLECGGLESLVRLLDFDVKRTGDTYYLQSILERVNDARDFLEDSSGRVDEAVAKRLVKLGARSKLERLRMSGFTDLRQDSQAIINLLRVY